jgi:hypothetical protein
MLFLTWGLAATQQFTVALWFSVAVVPPLMGMIVAALTGELPAGTSRTWAILHFIGRAVKTVVVSVALIIGVWLAAMVALAVICVTVASLASLPR